MIPWAKSDLPEESHQAQLKAELDQLRVSMKHSIGQREGQSQQPPKRERKQRQERDQDLGM